MVEFMAPDGNTLGVVTVLVSQVRSMSGAEVEDCSLSTDFRPTH